MATSSPGTGGRRFVLALGGNALIPAGQAGTWDEQLVITGATMDQVARLAADGNRIVLTHGNGPVVGNIILRGDAGMAIHGIPPMPMFVCGADSQGGLGFMLQQALQNSLKILGVTQPVAAVVTQVRVDPADPAFASPTKPIGPFYTEDEARRMMKETGWTIVEDSGRGWRRVVPSPKPVEIVEWEAIRALNEAGVLTIAAGGGGVPVMRGEDGLLQGVDAVIDKDRASALLAQLIGAEVLVIITQVDRVYADFGTPEEEALDILPVSRAASMLAAGEFPAGSMGPKIESALTFLENGGVEVVITSPEHILAAIDGRQGTRIVAD